MQQQFAPHNGGDSKGQSIQWEPEYQRGYANTSAFYLGEKIPLRQKGNHSIHILLNFPAIILVGMILSTIFFGWAFHWAFWLFVLLGAIGMGAIYTDGTIFSIRYRKTNEQVKEAS